MSNPVEAILALDNLPVGSRIVACGVESDGTAFGKLYEHYEGRHGRAWRDLTFHGAPDSSRWIVEQYDDVVIVGLGGEQ